MIRIDRNEVRNPLSLSLCSVFYLVSGQDEVFCVLICSLSSWGNLLLYMRFVWAVPLPPPPPEKKNNTKSTTNIYITVYTVQYRGEPVWAILHFECIKCPSCTVLYKQYYTVEQFQ